DPIVPNDISRRYAELDVDVRPPSFEKTYTRPDGTENFKHIVESYITYRRIVGIGDEFAKIIRFDERDAVANTNEIEYALVNRFFIRQSSSDVTGRRRRKNLSGAAQIKPVRPQQDKDENTEPKPPGENKEKPGEQPPDETQKTQKIEQGQKADLGRKNANRDQPAGQGQPGAAANQSGSQTSTPAGTSDVEATEQAYEVLSIKIAQKYFFDRDFGGALIEGQRNQLYPLNTLSGYTSGGVKRSFSPINVSMRYRPLSSVFADVRMDVGTSGDGVRSLSLGAGFRTNKLTVSGSYYLSRRIELEPNRFEAGRVSGDKVFFTVQFGDDLRGLYGGTRIGYDFTDRFVSPTEVSKGRLSNSRSYMGYSWDCCGVQFNYNTFKAGLRNEGAFSFTFLLAGLGVFGWVCFWSLVGVGVGGGGAGGDATQTIATCLSRRRVGRGTRGRGEE